jgi:hypothetical protein
MEAAAQQQDLLIPAVLENTQNTIVSIIFLPCHFHLAKTVRMISKKTIIFNYLAQYGLHYHNNHPNCVSWQHIMAESSLARFKFVSTILTVL